MKPVEPPEAVSGGDTPPVHAKFSGVFACVGTGVSNVVRRLQSGAVSAQGSPAAIQGSPAGSPALTSGLPRCHSGLP